MDININRNISFSRALDILKSGGTVARSGWCNRGQFLSLQIPTMLSKMNKPYIYIVCEDGELVPWVASQTDLLANDWHLVE